LYTRGGLKKWNPGPIVPQSTGKFAQCEMQAEGKIELKEGQSGATISRANRRSNPSRLI